MKRTGSTSPKTADDCTATAAQISKAMVPALRSIVPQNPQARIIQMPMEVMIPSTPMTRNMISMRSVIPEDTGRSNPGPNPDATENASTRRRNPWNRPSQATAIVPLVRVRLGCA